MNNNFEGATTQENHIKLETKEVRQMRYLEKMFMILLAGAFLFLTRPDGPPIGPASGEAFEIRTLSPSDMEQIRGACTHKAPDCFKIDNPCQLTTICWKCWRDLAGPDPPPPQYYYCIQTYTGKHYECQGWFFGIESCENKGKKCGEEIYYTYPTDKCQGESLSCTDIYGGRYCVVQYCPPDP